MIIIGCQGLSQKCGTSLSNEPLRVSLGGGQFLLGNQLKGRRLVTALKNIIIHLFSIW